MGGPGDGGARVPARRTSRMKRKRTHARMYHRPGRGWYADLRNYADVGGGQEALIPEGARGATEDQAQAALLFGRRLDYLQSRRAGRIPEPAPPVAVPRMKAYLERHAELKRADGKAREGTIAAERSRLERIANWWSDPQVDAIALRHFNELKLRLKAQAPRTRCHFINAVSSLLQSALSDGYVQHNVGRDVQRPRVTHGEAPYLEAAAGHALLTAAADLDAERKPRRFRPLAALIGTALLTGARKRELFTLLVEDIDFDAGVVHFRPNKYYGDRKSSHAIREVPLWPQLRTLLVPVVGQRAKGLLFQGAKGKPLSDVRAAVAEAFKRAKLPKPSGKEWHLFRHTYTAMRIQTLDHGAPVSLFTVAKELGHGSITLIEETYGHLLKERAGQRLDRVEYRALKVAEERTA
jgi:integrase